MSSGRRVLYRTLVSCFLLILIPCAESQFDLITSTTEHNSNTFALPPSVNCGETDRMVDTCFKDLPPPLMEFLLTTKIAINEDEIMSKCTVFKRGIKCFDRYSERCLSQDKVQIYQNNVAGAKRFLSKFCDDRKFQADYLRHKDCFSHIQDDWNRCTRDFQHILSDELHGRSHSRNTTGKFMQFCCSRHAYENCIYNSARFKCYKNSAKFARDTARMLAEEKHFSNCKQYENLLCAATEIDVRQNLLLLLLTLVAVTWKCSEVWWKLRF